MSTLKCPWFLLLLVALFTACSGNGRTPLETSAPGQSLSHSLTPLVSSPVILTETPSSAAAPAADTLFPTPMPLTEAAITSCPVSIPNVRTSPDAHYVSTTYGYGNADGSLFTELWPGGKVIFWQGGPGRIFPDGSMGVKWPWYRAMTGEVVVEGRRLDAPAPPISPIVLSATPDGYGEVGFLPSGLLFPSKGCWEVVATGEKFNLTFVTLVAKVSFEPRQAYWLPEGMLHLDTDVSNLPQSIGKIYGFANGDRGQIIVETAQGKRTNPDSYSKVARQPVEVSGLPGTCVQGAWDKRGQWQSDAYAGILAWMDGEFSYRISYSELELSCADLLRVAGSSS